MREEVGSVSMQCVDFQRTQLDLRATMKLESHVAAIRLSATSSIWNQNKMQICEWLEGEEQAVNPVGEED